MTRAFAVALLICIPAVVGEGAQLKTHFHELCVAGGRDLSSLPPLVVQMAQSNIEGVEKGRASEMYTWVLGWCNKVLDVPLDLSGCSADEGRGFIQQYGGSRQQCFADFTDWGSITADDQKNSVVIQVKQHDSEFDFETGRLKTLHRRLALVNVRCDPTMNKGEIEQDYDDVNTTTLYSEDRKYKDLTYVFAFKSLCACVGGCKNGTINIDETPPPKSHVMCHPSKDIDLSGADVSKFDQTIDGDDGASQIRFGFCSKVSEANLCFEEGGGEGFLQIIDPAGYCKVNFNKFHEMTPIEDPKGVRITVLGTVVEEEVEHLAIGEVTVKCDLDVPNILIPSSIEKKRISDDDGNTRFYKYTMEFTWACACAGNSKCIVSSPPPVSPPPVVDTAAMMTEPHQCKVGTKDLRGLSVKMFDQPLSTQPDKGYQWVVGFCTPVTVTPEGAVDPCSSARGAGFIQQYYGGSCLGDWSDFTSIKNTGDGVEIIVKDRQKGFTAHVNISCDRKGVPGEVHQLHHKPIDVKSGDHYYFNFKSLCACDGQCNIEAPGQCALGKRYLGDLLQHSVPVSEAYGEEYSIETGFCHKLTGQSEQGVVSPCDGRDGYAYRFQENDCDVFDSNFIIYEDGDGVVFQSETSDGKKINRVFLKCNPDGRPNEVTGNEEGAPFRVDMLGGRTVYTTELMSRCACLEGCRRRATIATPSPPALPAPSTPEMCKVGNIDISKIPVGDFSLRQQGPPGHGSKEYAWRFGWCRKVYEGPTGFEPCSAEYGAGFLSQYQTGGRRGCEVIFNEGLEVTKKLSSPQSKYEAVFIKVMNSTHGTHRKEAHITIECDPGTAKASITPLSSDVNAILSSDGKTVIYEFSFKSPCVCPTGCLPADSANKVPLPIEYDEDVSCSITSGKSTYILDGLPPLQIDTPVREIDSDGMVIRSESMQVSLGWCSKLLKSPTGDETCQKNNGGAGFVQVFDRKCKLNARTFDDIDIPAKDTVLLTYSGSDGGKSELVKAFIHCNRSIDTVREMRNPGVTLSENRTSRVYEMHFESKCACAGGCKNVSAPVPEQRPISADNDQCFGLSAEPTLEFELDQSYTMLDGKTREEAYFWVINFCKKISEEPTTESEHRGTSACTSKSGPGFVQQFRWRQCQADFNEFYKIQKWKNEKNKKDYGVEITVSDNQRGRHNKLLSLVVACNPSSNQATPAMDNVRVEEISKDLVKYYMRFESKRVCSSGCGVVCYALGAIGGCILAYFFVGFLYLKLVKRRSGIEAIPNGAFWAALPAAVITACAGLCARAPRPPGDWNKLPREDIEDLDDDYPFPMEGAM